MSKPRKMARIADFIQNLTFLAILCPFEMWPLFLCLNEWFFRKALLANSLWNRISAHCALSVIHSNNAAKFLWSLSVKMRDSKAHFLHIWWVDSAKLRYCYFSFFCTIIGLCAPSNFPNFVIQSPPLDKNMTNYSKKFNPFSVLTENFSCFLYLPF